MDEEEKRELLVKEAKDLQEKLCNEKHGTIDRRLVTIEKKQDRSMWFLLTTMVGIIISIGLQLFLKGVI